MKIRNSIPIRAALIAQGAVLVAVLGAIPAAAHTGSHTEALLRTILHWLTSPTHALLAVVGSIAVITLAVKLKNRRS